MFDPHAPDSLKAQDTHAESVAEKANEEERVHEAHDEVEVYVADPAPHVEAQGHEVGGHADDHPVCERTDGSCSQLASGTSVPVGISPASIIA